MIRNNILKITFITLSLALGITAASYYAYKYVTHAPQAKEAAATIIDFNDARDTKDILDIFEKDRYWLVATDTYDPAYALKTRSPNSYEEEYKGKLTIKVLRKGQDFIGFVAYYMKNFIEGFVLFLAVKPEYRGKHYGPQLMEYALNALKAQGAHIIRLVTRVSNVKAQAVYKRVGFIETARDAEYVFYMKSI